MYGKHRGAQVRLANGAPVEDLKINGMQALSSSTGEINANDKNELLTRIGQLMNMAESGQIVSNSSDMQSTSAVDQRQRAVEARAIIEEARNDATGKKWNSVGASLAERIDVTASRAGFMRRLLKLQPLGQGETPQIPVNEQNVEAVVSYGLENQGYQLVQGRKIYLDEFEIIANIRVDSVDAVQSNDNLLDVAYNEGLQSIMVREDRMWKAAADMTVGRENKLHYVSGKLTLGMFSAMQNDIDRWGLPTNVALIASDYWKDIQSQDGWLTALDPVSQYDLLFTGRLSTVFGTELLTDAFRDKKQRVLTPGEIYFVADQEYHGGYTDRGGVASQPTNGSNDGNTSKGWLLSRFHSQAIANARSVVKGQRIK